jgi:hypothetical protein
MLGFKRFDNAAVTISWIELAEKIEKGQFRTGRLGGRRATLAELWNAAPAAQPPHRCEFRTENDGTFKPMIATICTGASSRTVLFARPAHGRTGGGHPGEGQEPAGSELIRRLLGGDAPVTIDGDGAIESFAGRHKPVSRCTC